MTLKEVVRSACGFSRILAALAMLFSVAACKGYNAGEGRYSDILTFFAYADTLADSSIVVYVVPKPKMLRSGLANVEPGFTMAVSSLPRRQVKPRQERTLERGDRMAVVANLGFCSRARFRPELKYVLTLMGDLRNPRLEDSTAKSYGFYQTLLLDTLHAPPPDVRTGFGVVCSERKVLDER